MDCRMLAIAEEIHLLANHNEPVSTADRDGVAHHDLANRASMDDDLLGSVSLPDESAQDKLQQLVLDLEDLAILRDADLPAVIHSLYEDGPSDPQPDRVPVPFSYERSNLTGTRVADPDLKMESGKDNEITVSMPAQIMSGLNSVNVSVLSQCKSIINKKETKRKGARGLRSATIANNVHATTKRNLKKRLMQAVAPTPKDGSIGDLGQAVQFHPQVASQPASPIALKPGCTFKSAPIVAAVPMRSRANEPVPAGAPAKDSDFKLVPSAPIQQKKHGRASPLICDICNHQSGRLNDHRRHMLTHFPPQLKCPGCLKEFRREYSLRRHLTGGKKSLPCYIVAVERYGPDEHGNWKNMAPFRMAPEESNGAMLDG
ncbi:hypothetical protein PUNSTDRAFT_143833 [Punctularia strigosozonata HHB-11173 SS5]|uniref:uncharacterized protein n=1 Tax=Punctularia strigosozonata (strain HHB-11173) TaxID=741275 RepID=UPI000441627D|nr:uncharacterized protein PUNSTDRAFT_143833 [Punctularia strigosozonata HHB-11173 SS5]EIN08158.1 hypothetical protein PUNSTDRAFT_143833 [Punctularia strigosozonata HHB-11173 SS5]